MDHPIVTIVVLGLIACLFWSGISGFQEVEGSRTPSVSAQSSDAVDWIAKPYLLPVGLLSRSNSFENPTAAPGEGGKAASRLGVGRKGSHYKTADSGTTLVLADIQGSGTIRHIWLTMSDPELGFRKHRPQTIRNVVIRAYWDDQTHPSIECPVGEFFGLPHGKVVHYQSAVHSVADWMGMNIWLPMPFCKRARITLTNDGDYPVSVVYSLDHTLGDQHPEQVGRLHTLFRRENPTTRKQDFEFLPQRQGRGRYIGSVVVVRQLHETWWGEGEFKVYLDGDSDFPTICGTGSEDWAGFSHGIGKQQFTHHGSILSAGHFHAMYRWHLRDPIIWQRECRITMQQITYRDGVSETEDDWAVATFWYEPLPSAPLPPFPDVAARTANLWVESN